MFSQVAPTRISGLFIEQVVTQLEGPSFEELQVFGEDTRAVD